MSESKTDEPSNSTAVTAPEIIYPVPSTQKRIRDVCIPEKGTKLLRCPTNLDLTTTAGRAMLFNAVRPADDDLSRDGQHTMRVCWWVIHPDNAVDESTGEVKEFVRTVLIDKDGNTFRTTSQYLPGKIAEAMQLFTEEEWKDGITFQIRTRKSRRQGRADYHDFRILIQPE